MLHIIDSKTKIRKAIEHTPEVKQPAGVSPYMHAIKQRFHDMDSRIKELEEMFECLEGKYMRLLEQLAKKEKAR